MTYQLFQLRCFEICVALGYKDMRSDNCQHMLKYLTTEMLEAVINDKIELPNSGEHWTDWFMVMCKEELDNRIDKELLE